MSKCDATRCQTLRVKCIKFDFYWGCVPDTAGGGLQRPQTPSLYLRGPTSKGRGDKGGKGKENRSGGWKGKGGKGRGGTSPQKYFGLELPLDRSP